ncbi:MAG: hypothetical protein AB8G05_11355 [Oligoflexales bacterium]
MLLLIYQELRLIKKKIDLSKSPKKNDLISALEPGNSLNQVELIGKIYKISPYPEVSIRLWESTRAKLTKLISRTRKLANQNSNGPFNWFPYDKISKTWSLCKIKD